MTKKLFKKCIKTLKPCADFSFRAVFLLCANKPKQLGAITSSCFV